MNIRLEETAVPFQPGVSLLSSAVDIFITTNGIPVAWENSDHLVIYYDGKKALIKGQIPSHFFRGLGLLKEHLETSGKDSSLTITEQPVFSRLGASFDLSRNAVMTSDALTRMFCRLALMGYQEVYLYTEDTYDLPDYPFFGYMRGKYSPEEIRFLDEKACSLGLELIPCIQTLGHLERFLHWESSTALRDTPDVLLVDEDACYKLIESMIAQCRSCYRTNRIHVGMDEAMHLGLGAHLKKHGYQEPFSLMQRHVRRVMEIAIKYNFRPMMWSDMYFRCASRTNDYYEENLVIPSSVIDSAPEEMELVYWDYYHAEQSFYDHYIRLHQQFHAPLCFAGGMWTWLGPAPDYDVFLRNAKPALLSCMQNHITHVILTTWGDDGGETSPQAMLLGFQYYAEFCYRQTFDKQHVCSRLLSCTGADGNALSLLSSFYKTDLLSPESDLPNGAKFLLYQDPLLGIFDLDIEGIGFATQYANLEQCFSDYSKRNDAWQNLYLFYALLAKVLKNKSELGISLFHAYNEKDFDRLNELAVQAEESSADCRALLEQWRILWEMECRPFGFEILEIRLAGVCSRLETTSRRIRAFCMGKISEIEELSIQRLPLLRKKDTDQLHGIYFWKDIVSAAKP